MIRTPAKIVLHAPHLAPKDPSPRDVPVVAPPKRKIKNAAARVKDGRPSLQPATWQELHMRALAHEGEEDILWLAGFSARVGGNCECKANWRRELTILPPDFKNYFFWTVAIHNIVNARLLKPQVNIDEARKLWVIPSPAAPALQGQPPAH